MIGLRPALNLAPLRSFAHRGGQICYVGDTEPGADPTLRMFLTNETRKAGGIACLLSKTVEAWSGLVRHRLRAGSVKDLQ